MRRLTGSTTLRAAIVAALVAMLVAFPLGVLASHQFTDVPNSNTFHGDIDHVYDARITNGCTATTYCPDDSVSRGQMAAFMERGLGRVATDSNGFVENMDATQKELGSVTIRAGNVTGGTAFVSLVATGYVATATNDETGCNASCVIALRISQGGVQVGNFGAAQVNNVTSAQQDFASYDVSVVVSVPTGVDQTFLLQGMRYYGTGSVRAIGTLTATYLPFGAHGGNTIASDTTSAPAAKPESFDGSK